MDREGVTFETAEIRDGPSSKGGAHSARRQALESTPTEGVSGHEGRRRVTATQAEVASAIGDRSRSAERPERASAGCDRDVKGEDRHAVGRRKTCRKSERSRQSGLVGVNRRVPRMDRVQIRAFNSSDVSTGAVWEDRDWVADVGWKYQ